MPAQLKKKSPFCGQGLLPPWSDQVQPRQETCTEGVKLLESLSSLLNPGPARGFPGIDVLSGGQGSSNPAQKTSNIGKT